MVRAMRKKALRDKSLQKHIAGGSANQSDRLGPGLRRSTTHQLHYPNRAERWTRQQNQRTSGSGNVKPRLSVALPAHPENQIAFRSDTAVPRRYLEDRRRCGRQPTKDPTVADKRANAINLILFRVKACMLCGARWERGGRRNDGNANRRQKVIFCYA